MARRLDPGIEHHVEQSQRKKIRSVPNSFIYGITETAYNYTRVTDEMI